MMANELIERLLADWLECCQNSPHDVLNQNQTENGN